MNRILHRLAFAFFFGTVAAACHAADAPQPGASRPGGPPPGPPPEAVAACKGKTEGTTVSFTGHGGQSLSGVCRSFNGTLAAMPAGGMPRQGSGNPP